MRGWARAAGGGKGETETLAAVMEGGGAAGGLGGEA